MSCGSCADERDDLGLAGPPAAAVRLDRRRARLPRDPGAGRRGHRHRRRRPRLPLRDRRTGQPARRGRRGAPPRLLAVDLRRRRRARHQARHLRRPALRFHDAGRHRGLGADPPLLVRLHAVRRGLPPLLQLSQLLRLLDAAAGSGRQLRPADRRLGLRRLRLLRADQLLVPASDGTQGGNEGLRDQRRRRHRPRPRRLPDLPRAGDLRLQRRLRPGTAHLRPRRVDGDRDLPAAARRRLRQVGADPLPHLAAGRDGGPDPGLLADPRGDDGDRRRLPDRPHPRPLLPRPDRRRHCRLRRPGDAADRRHDRDRADRPQARNRLLDDEPDRLHDHGGLDRRLRAGPFPPDDPRLLQGAALHDRRLDHLGDGQSPGHRPDERLLAGDALHLADAGDRRPGAGRLPAHLGLLLQGLDPRLRRGARRDLHLDGDRRLRRRLPHRALHLPPRLPRAPGRALRGGAAPDRYRRALPRPADQPGQRRGRGHRDRLPRRHSSCRRGVVADGGGDGGARRRRALRRPDPGSRRRQRALRLPRASLRRLAAERAPPDRRRRVARPGDRRRDLAGRDRLRLVPLGGAAGAAGALPPAAPPGLPALPQQVVLRRGDRLPRRAAGARHRPLRRQRLRALRRRRPRHRHQGDRERRRRHRPRRAERLRPQLRAASARRLRRARPLFPAEQLMINSLLWTPLAFGLLGLFLPKRYTGWWAALGAAVTLGLAVALLAGFDSGAAGLQDTVDVNWIPGLGVDYSLGIDGLNGFLVVLTALLWLGGTAFAAFREQERPHLFFLMMLLGETATLGAFVAQDLLLFVLFFALMLAPFYFLFGVGGTDREDGPTAAAATLKMLVYTLIGSLLMLVGAIATAIIASDGGHITFSIAELAKHPVGAGSQRWIFWFFAAAFLVKMPAFLLHGWMPDAYRAAPLPVLAVFSGVLAKVGAYGFLRVVLPLFPAATVQFQEVVLVIALASILYGSVMAFTQTNVRLVGGYSSVAQLGFITAGIFALRADGADGAVLQMVNHGLVVAPLFIIVAILAERSGTEDLREMGGMAMRAPVLAALFLIVTLATLAMPGSANFIGEFYILNGLFQAKIVFAFVAISGVAMSAYYALRLYQRTMHNRRPEGIESREISLREGAVLVPLVLCILGLALYPQLILKRTDSSVHRSVIAVSCRLTAPASSISEFEAAAKTGRPACPTASLAKRIVEPEGW